MKYIVFSDNSVIVFPDSQSHKDMAMGRLVRSAGFCRVETFRTVYDDIRAKVSCWGSSDSLGVSSLSSDEEIIKSLWV